MTRFCIKKYNNFIQLLGLCSKFLSRSFYLFIAISAFVCFVAVPTAKAQLLPASEVKALNNYPNWVACDSSAQTSEQTNPEVGPVFVLGDSIMEGAYYETGKLKTALKEKNIEASVDAQSSRSIKYIKGQDTNPINKTRSNGLDAVDQDKSEINNANTIIIELGTNEDGSASTYKNLMSELVKKIKGVNSNAKIYIVNLFSPAISQRAARNNAIEAIALQEGAKVIDTTKANITMAGDRTHPKVSEGYIQYTKVIMDALTGSTGGSPATSSGGYSFTSPQEGWIDTDVNWGPMAGGGNASKTSFVALSSQEAAKTNPNMSPGDIIVLTYKNKTAYAIYGDSAADRSSSSSHPHGFGDGTKYLEVSPHAAVTLTGKSDNLPPGVSVTLYPGTAKRLGTSSADKRDQTNIDRVGAEVSGGGTVTKNVASESCCPNTDAATSTASVSGDLQDLAKQVLDNKKISFDYGPSGDVAANFKLIAAGKKAKTQDGREVDVQPILLVTLLNMAQKHTVNVSSLTDGSSHTSPSNPHGSGKAMDINIFDGSHNNGSDASAMKLIEAAAETLPDGSRFGMGNNPFGTKKINGKTFGSFSDNPSHVHFDVVGVSQSAIDKAVSDAGQGTVNTSSSTPQCCPSSGGSTTLSGKDNAEKAFNYFVGKGLTTFQAAVIVGTLLGETSNLDPKNTNEIGAHGIAQWTNPPYSNRRPALNDFAQKKGTDENDFATQLDFMWQELTGGYKSSLSKLKSVKPTPANIEKSVYDFEASYEVSGHGNMDARYAGAKQLFKAAQNGGSNLSTAGSSSSASADSSCGGGIGQNGDFVFPVKATKADYGSNYASGLTRPDCKNPAGHSVCHHDYFAADIGKGANAEGATVLVASSGTIMQINDPDKTCDGTTHAPRVHIKGDNGRWYFYQHLKPGSIKPKVGDKVKAGDELAQIGNKRCAEDTLPHLHFDVTSTSAPNSYFSRPGPDANKYLVDPMKFIGPAYEKLPNN